MCNLAIRSTSVLVLCFSRTAFSVGEDYRFKNMNEDKEKVYR